MAKFLVKLEIRIGEYLKNSFHLVDADDETNARDIALLDESHNGCAGIDDSDDEWWDDYMIYRVDYVKPLTLEEFKTLRTLLEY